MFVVFDQTHILVLGGPKKSGAQKEICQPLVY